MPSRVSRSRTDDLVDPLAQRMAGRHQASARPVLRRQREPARSRRAREIVGVHLGHIVAQLLEGAGDVAREARLDRRFQRRIALAHDLVHQRGLHAGGLELGEGLAGIDGVELLLVADQHHARDAERIGDPQEVAGLDGGGERALVDHQHALREGGAHLLFALGGQTTTDGATRPRPTAAPGFANAGEVRQSPRGHPPGAPADPNRRMPNRHGSQATPRAHRPVGARQGERKRAPGAAPAVRMSEWLLSGENR